MKTKFVILALGIGFLPFFFSCEKDNVVLADEAGIEDFSFAEETRPAIIDCSSNTVHCEVEIGTDLSNLTPVITVSGGATFPDNITGPLDFSDPVPIPVTAEDGSIRNWLVYVSQGPRHDADILVFFLAEQTSLATINKTNHTEAIEIVNGTDRSRLTPRFKVSVGAVSDPESSTTGDYSSEVNITVTAEDEITTQDWAVTVSEAATGLSDKNDILAFTLPGQTTEAVIDGDSHRVIVEVASGTNLSSITPDFILSPGATSVPVSETSGDYSSEVTISVTAEDGTSTQDWIVEVYPVDDFNPSIFCDENLCTTDEALQQECQDFLLNCLITQSGKDYDECLITALSLCKF